MAKSPSKQALAAKGKRTKTYQPLDMRFHRRPRKLPLLTGYILEQMLAEPTIRLGLAMRVAPLTSCEFAYKPLGSKEYVEGIQASSDVVAQFVYRQLKTIWANTAELLWLSQVWGWAAGEVVYKLKGQWIEVDSILVRHSRDVRALTVEGDLRGVRFSQLKDEGGKADLPFPAAIWHRHNPQGTGHYGQTILEGAYSPWWDKWGEGGALDVRRLSMQMYSISGRKGYYPHGTTPIESASGTVDEVPNRDIFRQAVEQMMAGSVAALPSQRDAHGNRLWEIEDATAMTGLEHVLAYPKDLDKEMLRGLEIPDDVLSADNSGAWEGKKVPMMAFYSSLDRWLNLLVSDVKTQVIDPMLLLNFGPQAWCKIETKPLAEQVMEQSRPPQESQTLPVAQPDTLRMSLDPVEAVGQGVLSAAELVKAATVAMRAHDHAN